MVAAGMSAVQHSCSLFSISNFQNKRGVIQSMMEGKLRGKLEGADGTGSSGVYARAISLQLRNIELPEVGAPGRERVSCSSLGDSGVATLEARQNPRRGNTLHPHLA